MSTEENKTNGSFAVTTAYKIYAQSRELLPAANKLAMYLRKLLGEGLEVLFGEAVPPFIMIGKARDDFGTGYRILAKSSDVCILGSDLAMNVRGIYAFLRSFAGIRSFISKHLSFTKQSVTVPYDTDISYHPYFEYADTDWLSPKDAEYSLFNGINGLQYRNIPKDMGGGIEYQPYFCHTLTEHFCPSKKYYESHPEYYAFQKGKRKPLQLCLTNPDVLKIVTQEVLDLLKEKHDPDAQLQIVTLTQHDNVFFCRCPECLKMDRRYQSHAGTMLYFVNRVARAVKAAGYENVALDTFAYRYTRKPPVGIHPDENVIVRLCSIECCFSHPFDDKGCKANRAFMSDLKAWSQICNRIYVWDYCTNFSFFVGIFPNFGVLQRNIQIMYENNVKGIYEEGNFSLDVCDTEFGELRAYLLTQLFMDPYCDLAKEQSNFLAAYYGDGGKYIDEFINKTKEYAARRHLGIYQSMHLTMKLRRAEVLECDELWKKAVQCTAGEAKENVLHSELCWRYWKMKNHKCEFRNLFKRCSEGKKLIAEIHGTGIKRMHEVDMFRTMKATLYQDMFFLARPLVQALLNHSYRL